MVRSSMYQNRIMLANNIGLIDRDYPKPIGAKLVVPWWYQDKVFIPKGTDIVQAVIVPYSVLDNVEDKNLAVRKDGFGHTDRG